MNSPALAIAQHTEEKLGSLYETLHQRERLIAARINRYAGKRCCNKHAQILIVNSALNLAIFSGLFYLLY